MFGTVSQASQASLFFMIGYTTSLNLEQNSPKRITAQLFYKAAFDLAKPGLAVEQKKKNPPITYSTLPHWFPLIRPALFEPNGNSVAANAEVWTSSFFRKAVVGWVSGEAWFGSLW